MGGSSSKIKTGSAHRERIVLFGDSLTQQSFSPQGWGAAIADAYQRRADVLNRGYSGYNTRWCVEMLRHGGGIMADAGPDDTTRLVTIFLGANDASLEDQNPAQHASAQVPLEEYKSNLREIIVITRERAPHAKILLIAPPPVCHAQRLQFQKERFGEKATGKLERTNENAGLYADAVEHVAADTALPCLNLWKVLQEESNWPELLSDGLHFSPAGNALVGTKILQKISEVFPDLAVIPCKYTGAYGNSGSSCSGITTDCPWWENIDTACPSKSFEAS